MFKQDKIVGMYHTTDKDNHTYRVSILKDRKGVRWKAFECLTAVRAPRFWKGEVEDLTDPDYREDTPDTTTCLECNAISKENRHG